MVVAKIIGSLVLRDVEVTEVRQGATFHSTTRGNRMETAWPAITCSRQITSISFRFRSATLLEYIRTYKYYDTTSINLINTINFIALYIRDLSDLICLYWVLISQPDLSQCE